MPNRPRSSGPFAGGERRHVDPAPRVETPPPGWRGRWEQERGDGFACGGFTDEGGRGAVIQHLRGGESLGQGEKSGEGQWAGTPGGLRVGVYLKRGQLRRKSRCPGQGAGGGGFSLQEVKGGGGGVSQKSCGGWGWESRTLGAAEPRGQDLAERSSLCPVT